MTKQINVPAGTDLFRVAADELNDATQWVRIAAQNGLSDPLIVEARSLVIPDPDPAATGGAPPQ